MHLRGSTNATSLFDAALQAVQGGHVSSDPGGVRAAVAAQLQEVWVRLRWLASARGKLRDVRRLMEVEVDTGAASSTRPLLRQVLGKILLQVWTGREVSLLRDPRTCSCVHTLCAMRACVVHWPGVGDSCAGVCMALMPVLRLTMGLHSTQLFHRILQDAAVLAHPHIPQYTTMLCW
jgi:hypothetical protein